MEPFADRLANAVRRVGNPVVVGLDPRADQLPEGILDGDREGSRDATAEAYTRFCSGVIDAVSPLVAVVKVQAALFEQLGPAGMVALGQVIQHARARQLIVIFDGKRGDIGSTAVAYADGILGSPDVSAWGADALTVNPYLGDDSLEPFVDVAQQRGAGIFVLVKTSNPGGKTFQDLVSDGQPLYRHVGQLVNQLASQTLGPCGYGAVGAVVGATYPQQLDTLRALMPQTWFLVPGFGTQGGTAADVAGAFDQEGLGAVVNSSRGIIFAHTRAPYRDQFGPARWQEAVEAATRDMIERLRAETPAGKL